MTESAKKLAVIMERKVLANKWANFQWEAVGVVPDREPGGREPRPIYQDEVLSQWLFPGFEIRLYTDEAEFYYANLTSPAPRVFVMWRAEDELARPALVTVSYGEAARMMDANEQVDGVPMPEDLVPWIAEFVERHYKPEKKQKSGHYATTKLDRSHG